MHSLVCESILLTADAEKKIKLDGVIYGRNYKGYFNNALFFQEDFYPDELGLLSFAYTYSRFIKKFNSNDITLVLPHSLLNIFVLFAAHKSVTKVMYVEEGNLSYDDTLELQFIPNQIGQEFSDNITYLLDGLGFDCAILNTSRTDFYTNCFNKYDGVLASSHSAFKNLPGKKTIVNLRRFDYFPVSVALILIPGIDDLSKQFDKNFATQEKIIYKEHVSTSVLISVVHYIESVLSMLPASVRRVIAKKHPSTDPVILNGILAYFPIIENYDDTDISYETKGFELGYINFSHFFSIGTSSVLRYAARANISEEKYFVREIVDSEILNYSLQIYDQLCKNSGQSAHTHGAHVHAQTPNGFTTVEDEDKNAVISNNLGVYYFSIGQFENSVQSYEKAIALNPRYIEAYNNLGNACVALSNYEGALSCYDRSIALDPGYVEAYWNKALALLQLGLFSEGWVLYESRWAKPSFQPIVRNFAQPIWDGSFSVVEKTLLLHAEQGLGDTLQFFRYVDMVQALGARLVVEVQAPLVPLLEGLEGVTLVKQGDPLPPFECHCPLMSLPLAFQTTLSSIPSAVPYLKPSSEKERFWAEKLGPTLQLRVGLVWSGDPRHQNDKQRSMALSELMAALPPGFEYVSLQPEIRESDSQAFNDNDRFVHFGSELKDFSDTAALCAQMDVVVCVDTSVAHLSGALGKPTFLMLPYNPDWRWLLERTDSPWYPTMQLYRQAQLGNWHSVLQNLSSDLLELEKRRITN